MAEIVSVRAFDGTALHVERSGAGPAVVLCDGLGCDGFIWKYLGPTLQSRYTVVHPHYRGHGRSQAPQHIAAVGVSALRADLLAVLDALQLDQVALIGHSMGAQVVLDFALAYPERAVGVVSLCGSYGRPLDTLRGSPALGRLFPLLKNTLARFPSAAERAWQWFFRTDFSFNYARRFEANEAQLVADDFKPYFDHLSQMDPQMFVALVSRLQEHSVLDRLHELRMPALLVAGERDTFCPAVLSRRMHRAIPRSTLVIVPHGSHVAPLENAELVERATVAFLRDLMPHAASRAKSRRR